jgi:hypothetical protein
MKDLNQDTSNLVLVYCDNKPLIQVVENPTFHARTKHIEVHHHFTGDKVLSGDIDLIHIDTNKQVVDVLTESLSSPKMGYLCGKMGIKSYGVEREY